MKCAMIFKVSKAFEATKRFVARNFTFITVMICCNLPILATYSNAGTRVAQLAYIIVVNALLALLVGAVPRKKVRRGIQAVIITLSLLFFFVDTYFSFFYQGVPDQSTLEVIFATTTAEASGYIRANMMSLWLYIVFVAVMSLFYLIIRYVGRFRRNALLVTSLSAGIWLGVILIAVNVVESECSRDRTTYKRLKYASCSFLRNTLFTVKAIKNMHALNRMRDGMKTKPVIVRNESSIPYVVYILGESTSRHRMGMYGYRLDTTPFMSAREKQGDLTRFTDVISPNATTMNVLAKLFSYYRHDMPGEWYETADLFTILREAGYYTTWVSNQEFSGRNGNNARLYAERCNNYAFTTYRNSTSSTIREPYDEAVLPLLDKTLQTPRKKNFIVVHLMGSHQLYSNRFPQERRKFGPESENGPDEKVRGIRADYDNAVRYNDSIVNAIVSRFENKNAIIVYTSDHGEDVMEINKKAAGHNDINPNQLMVEIPMLVWTSKAFRTTYPALANRVRRAAHRPFVTEDMIHSLLDLMQIQTPEYRESLSVFSDQYDATRPRYFTHRLYRPALSHP